MRLSIMQPYLFPYVGYFQLLAAADTFVIYDDVNYIRQGWINRNNILVQGAASRFSVPIKAASSFTRIHETQLDERQYPAWREKFYKTLTQNYAKSPHFAPTMALVKSVLDQADASIGDLAAASVIAVAQHLGLPSRLVRSSSVYGNDELKAADRVLDICKRENATDYINVAAGEALYSREFFAGHGIRLHFLKPRPIQYAQFGSPFVPWLSIIDLLMFNDAPQVRSFLQEFDLA
jgi:hypothetical protein